jgi:hypothetical protein
MKPIKSLQ